MRRSRLISGCYSAGQRLGEKGQALVEPIIDTRMVVGELFVAMCNAELVQPSDKPTGTVEQIELIIFAAIDVERLQVAQIVRLGLERDYGVLAQPIDPAFLDNLACVEFDRQPDPKELCRIRIVAGRPRPPV